MTKYYNFVMHRECSICLENQECCPDRERHFVSETEEGQFPIVEKVKW